MSTYKTDTEKVIGGKCLLPFDGYVKFWEEISKSEANCTYFCECLVRQITLLDKKNPEKEKTLTNMLDLGKSLVMGNEMVISEQQSRQAISLLKSSCVNILFFASLTFLITPSPKDAGLKAAVAAWQKNRSDKAPREFIDEVMRLLSLDQLDVRDILLIVELCCDVYCHRGSESPLPLEKSEASDYTTVARCFVYPFLLERVRKGQYTCEIVDTIVTLLRHPNLTESRLLCLLFLLKQILSTRPFLDSGSLQPLIQSVKPFYLWPLPHGAVARDVLEFLTGEVRAPGHGLRKQLLDEHPGMSSTLETAGCENEVFVIANPYSRAGQLFQRYFQDHTVAAAPEPVDVLSNILEACCADGANQQQLEHVRKLDDETLHSLCRRACDAVVEHEASKQASSSGLHQQMAALKAEVLAAPATSPARPSPSTPQLFCRQGLAAAAGTPKYVPAEAVPSLPNLKFVFFPQEKARAVDEKVGSSCYPRTAAMDQLEALIVRLQGVARTKTAVIRIALAGGDGTVHNFVCSYVSLRQSRPDLWANIAIRVYVFPMGVVNQLATYIAQYDGWYCRHVLMPFSSPLPVVPHLMPVGSSTPAVDSSVNRTPMHVFQNLGQSYIRESSQTLNVNIYDCECYILQNGEYVLTNTIPFCQRFELGFNAHFRGQQENRTRKLSSYDKEDKTGKFPLLDLHLCYTQMNLFAVPRQKPTVETKGFFMIVASNVPRVGERATLPQPHAEWLEVYCLDSEPATMKKQKKGTKLTYEVDTGTTQHVSQLEIEIADKNRTEKCFDILLDGELYGPFQKIKISACKAPGSGEIIALPVQHYFPMDL